MGGVSNKHCLLTFFILHAFMSSVEFFQYQLFENSFSNTLRISKSLDPDQARSGLDWTQTVCYDYQQTTLVGKVKLLPLSQQNSLSYGCVVNLSGCHLHNCEVTLTLHAA